MTSESDSAESMDRRLDRLKAWRNRKDRDDSMGFLQGYFKAQVERPYKQVRGVVAAWRELVPAEVAAHTRLESLSRGTLRVVVDSSAWLYELDRLLRDGLEQRLITGCRSASIRRVKLVVGQGG